MNRVPLLIRILITVHLLIALFVGFTAFYAAWEHNPQHEFHDDQTGFIALADAALSRETPEARSGSRYTWARG